MNGGLSCSVQVDIHKLSILIVGTEHWWWAVPIYLIYLHDNYIINFPHKDNTVLKKPYWYTLAHTFMIILTDSNDSSIDPCQNVKIHNN